MINKVVLILIVFSFVAFAQSNLNNKFRLGQTFETSGNLDKAKDIYQELANLQPHNNQYSNSLNDVFLKLKEYENSIKFLSNRIKQRPNDVSLYGMLGASHYLKGDVEKAVEVWDAGISVNNYSLINYTIISNSAIQFRAFEIATKYLEEGKNKSKNPTQFSYQLAQIYTFTMEYKKAASEYVEALIQQPSQLSYIQRRMDTYLSAVGAIDESIEVVSKELENNFVKQLLSYLYKKNNQFDKAFNLELELEKVNNSDGVKIYNFANEAYQARQLKVASQAYSYVVDNYPNSRLIPNCKVGFARTLEASLDKEWAENRKDWKPISAIDSTGASKYNEVIESYKSILLFVDGELANESLFRIGKIYKNKFANLSKAEEYFQKIISNSSLSIYFGKANFELAKIDMQLNNLLGAKRKLEKIAASSQSKNDDKEEAKFLHARIHFYENNFELALSLIANIKQDLSNNISNDAIELEMIINVGKKDSASLAKFANAEFLSIQNNFLEAEAEYKNLSENKNLFFVNNISRYKYAVVLVAQGKYGMAIEILKELSESKEMNIFADKSFYLLAQVYELGIKNEKVAIATYEKFLELFPNSLYLEKSQKNLINLKNKRSENL
jgi:tetratricopeptide (TPR) repeat protein